MVEIYEEYPASHRYVVGRGRSILIAFPDNCRYTFCILYVNPTIDSLFLSFFLIHYITIFVGEEPGNSLSWVFFLESHQLQWRSQLQCLVMWLDWKESTSKLTCWQNSFFVALELRVLDFTDHSQHLEVTFLS